MFTRYSIRLAVCAVFIGFYGLLPASASAARRFDSVQGGYSVLTAEKVHGLKKFPKVEAFTPLPSDLRLGEDTEVLLICEAEVLKLGEAVAGASGRFETELLVLDRSSGRLETFEMGSETLRVASDGYGVFYLDIDLAPFHEKLQSEDVSGWLRTHGSFFTKRGDNLLFVCLTFGTS